MTPRGDYHRNEQGMLLLRPALAALALCNVVLASVGDKSIQYRRCVLSCQFDTCRNHRPVPTTPDTIVPADPLPWYLVLTGWTCESNCEYHCTHRVTNAARRRVEDIHKDAERTVYGGYEMIRQQHSAWKHQQEADRAGLELDYCTDEYHGPGCIPRVSAPQSLPASVTLEQSVHKIVNAKLAQLEPIEKDIVQFYGKWPHLRILGMQEPLSVIFSLFNLVVQLEAMANTFGRDVPDTYPLKGVYLRHTQIASVAWLASAVFHARDLPWTERWDYFSAAAVLLSGFFLSIARIFRLAPGTRVFRNLFTTFAVAWLLHVLYLSILPRFDYGYNMTACLFVGVAHNLLWLAYAVAPRALIASNKDGRPHGDEPEGRVLPSTGPVQKRQLVLLVIFMFAAPSLELFDFPPVWRALDAHALWHLATVPLTSVWYKWLANDTQECVALRWWRAPSPAHASHSMLPTGVSSTVIVDVTGIDDSAAAGQASATPHAATRWNVGAMFEVLVHLGLIGLQTLRVVHGLLVIPPATAPRERAMSHVP